jgi:hemoglobin
MKKDIESRKDVEQLVDRFYTKVRGDATIGFIFNDIAHINWEKHLPVMYDFWENTLFYTGNYDGNPMKIHQDLHRKIPFTEAHFQQWITLFNETIDELFEGVSAETARQRALSISTIMKIKILHPTTEVPINTTKK